MAGEPVYRVALLSVHPEYAEAIANGRKTIEFRRRPLAADVTHVAVYATRPVARVVAVFSVEEQIRDSPQKLWRKYRKVAGISRDKFLHYFEGCTEGVGIRVGYVVNFDQKITLQEAFGISRPPQSYQYFAPHQAAARLVAAMD